MCKITENALVAHRPDRHVFLKQCCLIRQKKINNKIKSSESFPSQFWVEGRKVSKNYMSTTDQNLASLCPYLLPHPLAHGSPTELYVPPEKNHSEGSQL